MNKQERLDVFKEELSFIKNPQYKLLAENILENVPQYFFEIPASTSGKYHPAISLGDGGLVRHTKMVAKLMITLYNLKMWEFTDNQKDLLLIAAMSHDMIKKGDNKTAHTVKNHAEYAVAFVIKCIRNCIISNILPDTDNYFLDSENDIHKYLIMPIETHMGEWGEKDTVPVQYPTTEPDKLLHVCDYLASKKFISIEITQEEIQKTTPKTEDMTLGFGKYRDKTFQEVKQIDLPYLKWCYNNLESEALREKVTKFLKEEKLIK